MNLTPWAWLILPLGVCRAVQIALFDRIFRGPRTWLLAKLNPQGLALSDPGRPYFSYLLECQWCVSVWIGLAAIGLSLWDATRAATLIVLAGLALSLLALALDRSFDRWLPDEPHTTATIQAGGIEVEGPPGHVADAFEKLSGDDATGAG